MLKLVTLLLTIYIQTFYSQTCTIEPKDLRQTKEIYIPCVTAETNAGIPNCMNCRKAYYMALDDVRKSGIIKGWNITGDFVDEDCSPTLAVKAIFDMLDKAPWAIVGASCSATSKSLSLVSSSLKIPMISPSSTNPSLSDRSRYPYFFRVVSPDTNQAAAIVSLVKHYNWNRVAVLTSNQEIHLLISNSFIDQASAAGMEILTEQIFTPGDSMDKYMKVIKDVGATIIFMACYGPDAYQSIITAMHPDFDMYKAGYVWIGTDSWIDYIISYNLGANFSGVIGTKMSVETSDKVEEFTSRLVSDYNAYQNYSFNAAQYLYDAMFVLAKAISIALEQNTTNIHEDIKHQISLTNFTGITPGIISFDKNGDRRTAYDILNVVNGTSLTKIAIWEPITQSIIEKNVVVWPGGTTIIPLDTNEVTIGGYFPDSFPNNLNEPAFHIAVEDIQNDKSILPNWKIKTFSSYSKSSPLLGISNLIKTYNISKPSAIIGDERSIVAAPMALVTPTWNVPQISYASADAALSDKSIYPYFFRVIPPYNFEAYAWLGILNFYGWKKVNIINSNEDVHTTLVKLFTNVAQKEGIEIVTSQSFPGSINAQIDNQLIKIRNTGVTVIMVACYTVDVLNLLTSAKRLGMLTNEYAWIGSRAVMIQNTDIILNSSLSNLANGIIGSGVAYSEGPSYKAFNEKYRAKTNTKAPPSATYTYDAVLITAITLHKLLEEDKLNPTRNRLEFGKKFRDALFNIDNNRSGITPGKLSFNSNGDRLAWFGIYNYQGNPLRAIPVGNWISENNSIILFDNTTILWPGNGTKPPNDTLVRITGPVNPAIKGVVLFLISFCVLGDTIFLIVFTIYQKSQIVKAAKYKFCVLINFAGYLAFISAYSIVFEKTNITCLLIPWFGHTGFFLAFGCLIAKNFWTWRVYSNATKHLRVVNIPEKVMMACVAMFCTVIWIILILWTIFDPPSPVFVPDSLEPRLRTVICMAKHYTFTIIIFAVEFVVLIIGMFLSYQTRKVEILRFNESSHIALCIYTVLFFGLITIPLVYFVTLDSNIQILLNALAIIATSGGLLSILFIPKIWNIYLELNGKAQDLKKSNSKSIHTSKKEFVWKGKPAATVTTSTPTEIQDDIDDIQMEETESVSA